MRFGRRTRVVRPKVNYTWARTLGSFSLSADAQSNTFMMEAADWSAVAGNQKTIMERTRGQIALFATQHTTAQTSQVFWAVTLFNVGEGVPTLDSDFLNQERVVAFGNAILDVGTGWETVNGMLSWDVSTRRRIDVNTTLVLSVRSLSNGVGVSVTSAVLVRTP